LSVGKQKAYDCHILKPTDNDSLVSEPKILFQHV